jgi:hypothetical protein
MQVLAPLLDALRGCLEGFPDKRRGTNATYRMVDFGMAAFSAFFMQSPSFQDHQRRLENGHGRSNYQTLFDIPKIPTDNQIRDMLDPVEPERLYPVFAEPVATLEGANGGLDPFRRLGGHVLIALDGTEYFSSKKIHCHNCSTRQRSKGEKYFRDLDRFVAKGAFLAAHWRSERDFHYSHVIVAERQGRAQRCSCIAYGQNISLWLLSLRLIR